MDWFGMVAVVTVGQQPGPPQTISASDHCEAVNSSLQPEQMASVGGMTVVICVSASPFTLAA